jgi:hypothetical protein
VTDDPDALREQIHGAEIRLTALRARRQRWLTRYEAVENVKGESVTRAQAKNNLKLCDEQIAAAEKKLNAAQHRATVAEGREIAIVEQEENMVARTETELDDLRRLAADCDTHAAGLGSAIKQLHSKITEIRQRKNGRGPSGLMVTSMLERCSSSYFIGSPLRTMRGPLAAQRSFSQTVEAWMPSLSPATQASPPSPAAPRKPAPTYERKHAAPSIEGAPRFD